MDDDRIAAHLTRARAQRSLWKRQAEKLPSALPPWPCSDIRRRPKRCAGPAISRDCQCDRSIPLDLSYTLHDIGLSENRAGSLPPKVISLVCRPHRTFCRGTIMLPRRKFLHLAASAAMLPGFSRIAVAQTYPTRAVQ